MRQDLRKQRALAREQAKLRPSCNFSATRQVYRCCLVRQQAAVCIMRLSIIYCAAVGLTCAILATNALGQATKPTPKKPGTPPQVGAPIKLERTPAEGEKALKRLPSRRLPPGARNLSPNQLKSRREQIQQRRLASPQPDHGTGGQAEKGRITERKSHCSTRSDSIWRIIRRGSTANERSSAWPSPRRPRPRKAFHFDPSQAAFDTQAPHPAANSQTCTEEKLIPPGRPRPPFDGTHH